MVWHHLKIQVGHRIEKGLQNIFKENGLSIVIKCNMKVVNYLDVTLNLNDGSFKPFHKPDDETNYINAESDHPPNIIKQLPISIEKRLSVLSSSKEIFEQSKHYYQNALEKSGHEYKLQYKPAIETNRRRRGRKIIWFNPPFSRTVSTNVGKQFLNLIDKHFPRNHKFRKLFNRNNIKVSYGCMPNVGSVITAHNKRILENIPPLEIGGCNCQVKNQCPLNGHCLTDNLLYEATISSDIPNYSDKIYKGITRLPFKTRDRNHKKSFNHPRYKNDTELSKEVWNVKSKEKNYMIKWKMIKQYPDYNPATKRCLLCINEKLHILEHKDDNILNKRSEIISKCRHQNRHKLKTLTSNRAEGIT